MVSPIALRTAERLLRWAAQFEPSIQAALIDAWRRAQAGASFDTLVARLAAGDIDGALTALFDNPVAVAGDTAARNAYAAALQTMRARAAQHISVQIVAPHIDQALVALVRTWENSTYDVLRANVREGLREQIATEFARGIGPRDVARAIKTNFGRVGLTAYDETLVANYRRELETGKLSKALRRALRDKRMDGVVRRGAATPEQINRMVAKYRDRLTRARAQTMARTSAIDAANAATTQSWKDAVDAGTVALSEVRRYWVVADDERLCPKCEPMPALNADGVGLFEPFQTMDGDIMNPTLHPSCRCTVWIRVERAGIAPRPQPGRNVLIMPKLIKPPKR